MSQTEKPAVTASAADGLGALLHRCRIERGVSLKDAARALRLSASGVMKIERGLTRKPHETTRYRLVQFLRKHGYFPKEDIAA